ncbi:MAG: DEAD/DEAH box helicase [Candidatus Buchananbacteria bacterium]|nr:DEAD/DEAH box helicase [Candidatus Buchananbacteria bacterium]
MYNKRSKNRFGQRSNGSNFSGYQKRKPYNKFSRSSGGNRKRHYGNKRNRKQQTIDISRFVKKSAEIKNLSVIEIKHKFTDFKFCEQLQTNLIRLKFITPTPIQDQAIPYVLNNKDVVGLANTGTGKTGVFLLPLINKVFHDKTQQVLIVAPTRELALQIDNDFRAFAQGMQIYSSVIIGGTPIAKQLHSLKRRPHFVIGTPGRLKDIADRKALKLQYFNNVVLDEIDRMMDMGFIKPITELLQQTRSPRQTLFFSATLPDPIKLLINRFLDDPVTININSGQTADNVDQDIVRFKENSLKFEALKTVLAKTDCKKVLIFSETKRDVEKLTNDLNHCRFRAASIHGDKRQYQRQKALNLFRDNKINILVATDVAARGLDIKDISHVINYTVPQTYDDYIHRIGRTGRGSKNGQALTFVR